LRWFGYIAAGLFLTLTVAMIVFLALTESVCGAESVFVEELVPPAPVPVGWDMDAIEIATEANMQLNGMESVIDMTGVWWIRWSGDEPVPLYSHLHLEELITLAGVTTNVTTAPWFPAKWGSPTGAAHHWAFSNTIVGRVAMMVAANKNPNGNLNIFWSNASHAFIGGGGDIPWYLDKIDNDRWLRTMGRRPDPYERMWYELVRVIKADGTPHEQYWPAFVKHMAGTKPRMFTTSDKCIRECGLWRFMPCWYCEWKCGSQ